VNEDREKLIELLEKHGRCIDRLLEGEEECSVTQAAQMLREDGTEIRLSRKSLMEGHDREEKLKEEINYLQKECDGLREGKCFPCEETDKVNNELRIIVIPKLKGELKEVQDCLRISKERRSEEGKELEEVYQDKYKLKEELEKVKTLLKKENEKRHKNEKAKDKTR